MPERKIKALELGGQTIYVEVAEVEQPVEAIARDGFQKATAANRLVSTGEQVRGTISALAVMVHEALSSAKPAEWTLEINIGFNDKTGIPFIAEGGANGAVKISAKWKKD